ncbi:MAG: chalcone isomerase family protein [Thiobacillus sp.]
MSRNSDSSTLRNGLAALALCVAFGAQASPLPHLTGYEAVGSGTLRFLGLRIYDATLWAPRGAWASGQPFALELRYSRRFDGAAIAKRSIDEIRAQRKLPEATLARWEAELAAIFPDVREGDRLIGVRTPGEGATFYRGTRVIGRIDDEALAEAFFDIWLAPATRAPELRARLLGET